MKVIVDHTSLELFCDLITKLPCTKNGSIKISLRYLDY